MEESGAGAGTVMVGLVYEVDGQVVEPQSR